MRKKSKLRCSAVDVSHCARWGSSSISRFTSEGEIESDRQLGAESAVMWTLDPTVAVEDEAELEGVPFNLCSNPHLRSWTLANVLKRLRSIRVARTSNVWHEPPLYWQEQVGSSLWFGSLINPLWGNSRQTPWCRHKLPKRTAYAWPGIFHANPEDQAGVRTMYGLLY